VCFFNFPVSSHHSPQGHRTGPVLPLESENVGKGARGNRTSATKGTDVLVI
jgi:hypothetical protein